MLRKGQTLDIKYRDHVLTGNYEGYRECHIKPDWLFSQIMFNQLCELQQK